MTVLKTRSQQVIISHHAWDERWPQRVGAKLKRQELLHRVRAGLTNMARGPGIKLDSTGAGRVEVMPGVQAVVRLTERGWVVVTVELSG